MRHTPGPWESRHDVGAGWSVRAPAVGPVCSMAWWQFDNPGVMDDEISASNARLIAAAPDLLAACKSLLSIFDPGRSKLSDELIRPETDAIRAAVSKAEGEPASIG